MSSLLTSLPALLDVSDDDEDSVIVRLYPLFRGLFIDDRPKHFGVAVEINLNVIDEGKEEMFWHLVLYNQKRGRDTFLDRSRAARLLWVKPVIEALPQKGLHIFDHQHKLNVVRRYVWLPAQDYRVILQPVAGAGQQTVYRLISAHYIDFDREKWNMRRKYSERIRELS